MTLAAFGEKYELGTDIVDNLTENAFKNTQAFHHLTLKNLCEMEFKLGEITTLQDTVEDWLQSTEVF